MSKIKKIMIIIIRVIGVIAGLLMILCIIVAIVMKDEEGNENTTKIDKAEISKRAEMLRKNTLTFETLYFTRGFNLYYVQNLEGPVKYVDRNGNANNIFTINFVFQGSMKVTNSDEFEWQNLKAFEVAGERIKYDEIEPIDYPFRMKSDDEKDYTELNFKNIVGFAAMSDFINGKSYLSFVAINPMSNYTFTFTNAITAELSLSVFKGYVAEEINMITGRPLRNKDDDF